MHDRSYLYDTARKFQSLTIILTNKKTKNKAQHHTDVINIPLYIMLYIYTNMSCYIRVSL